jgi:hypothetical protein
MNFQSIKNTYFNNKFITLYIAIFIILFVFCSFIKFIGQIPVLIILTFLIAYYINNNFFNKINKFFNES